MFYMLFDLQWSTWADVSFLAIYDFFFLIPTTHTLPSTELTLEQCEFEPPRSTYLKRKKKKKKGFFFSKYWIYTIVMHSLWLVGSADLETWIQRAHCKTIYGFWIFYCEKVDSPKPCVSYGSTIYTHIYSSWLSFSASTSRILIPINPGRNLEIHMFL